MRVIYRACLLFLVACATRLSTSTVSADEILEKYQADPDKVMSLMQNPKFLELFQSEKLQGYMNAMMAGGEEALAQSVSADPEAEEMMKKLRAVMEDHLEL